MAKGKQPKRQIKEQEERSAKKDALDLLISEINSELKEGGSVQRGSDISYLPYQRIPSGSLSLDLIMGGGLPRAAIVQYKGEESTAKTTMAMQACALAQKRGENVAWGASEGFVKDWARTNGCFIPFSQKELVKFVEQERFTDMNAAKTMADGYLAEHEGYGDFVLVQTRSGPKLLEVVSRLVRSGELSIVVLDSAGSIISDEDDDKEIGDEQRVGGNSKIITHFVNKVRKSFNAGLESTVTDPKTKKQKKVIVPNKTCVIVINQVRSKIGGWSPQGTPPPDAGGGFGLKHGKDIDIRFQKGDLLQVSHRGEKVTYGRQVKAKCEKNKTAPPLGTASWNLFFKDLPDELICTGTIDRASEILDLGMYYGLINQKGKWFVIEEEQCNGKEEAILFLRDNPEIMDTYHETILELAAKAL